MIIDILKIIVKFIFFVDEQLCDVWDMIMILLEDDDVLVRNTVSKLNTRNESTTKIM